MIRIRAIAAVLCQLFSISLAAAAQQILSSAPQKTYVISGVMVRQGTSQPLKRVRVTIAKVDRRDQESSLITAADGRFTFTNVPAGKYSLSAEWRGVSQTFQQNEFFSTGIAAGPSLDSEHIVFPLAAPASLAVRIIDEEGEPVRGGQLWLFRRRIVSGWPQIQITGQTNTDSEGTGRFPHLESGIYYVAAGGRPWYSQDRMTAPASAPQGQGAAELDVAYPITYYAGVQDPDCAAPITLGEGDATKLQIALRAVPATHISLDGMPANPESANHPPEEISASVEVPGPGGIRLGLSTPVMFGSEGQVVGGLAPGSYLVSVWRNVPAGSGPGPIPVRPQPLGTVKVNAAADTRLNVPDLPKTSVSGKLVMESGDRPAGLAIWLGEPFNGQNALCRIEGNGSFQCTMNGAPSPSGNLVPGRYEVRLANTNELYIKSLAVRGARYASRLLEVTDGAAVDLSITAAKGLTKLSGLAMSDGRPVSGAMVLLAPEDPNHGPEIPRDQSDSDGTFTLPNVHPGRYLLLAIDDGRNLEYHNRQVLRPYLAQAQRIEIPPANPGPVPVNVQKRQAGR